MAERWFRPVSVAGVSGARRELERHGQLLLGDMAMRSSLITALILALYTVCAPNHDLLAQQKPAPVWTLNEQKTTLSEQLPSVPPVTLTFDAAEVEKLIETLAQSRAEMQPPRPIAGPVPGSKLNVATVGWWYVQRDGDGIVLAILHPGYGWVALHLDPSSTEQLSQRLPRPVRARVVRAKHVSRQ
jgi:hypothetical protein